MMAYNRSRSGGNRGRHGYGRYNRNSGMDRYDDGNQWESKSNARWGSFGADDTFDSSGGRGYRGHGSGHSARHFGGGGRASQRGRRDEDGSYDEGSQNRERPPPGLRGREIGLWYARRGQARREKEEKKNRSVVSMDSHRERNIRKLLNNLQDIQATDAVQQASASTSYDTAHFVYRQDNPNRENVAVKEEMMKEDPPDSWEALDDSVDDADDVEVLHVEPPTERSSCQSEDNMIDLDDFDDDGNPLPTVAGVVQYMKSHGDYPYASDEPESDFLSVTPASDNPRLDQQMLDEARKLNSNSRFISMSQFRQKLPSYQMRETIVETIRDNQVVVISGETGCGKTTQVPQFILDDCIYKGVGSQCRIICTQPRRISAISVAERVAAERCEVVNTSGTSSVGYQIRLETKRPRSQGSILFCTTGIVLKFLEGDQMLMRATHVIIDEIHERDLQSDFLMIILKDLLPRRPDLKVILMSATLNAEMFSHYFDGCPMLNIPGYTFPVTEYLLEDTIQMTGFIPQENEPSRRRRPRNKRKPEDFEEEENYQVYCRNLIDTYDSRTCTALRNYDHTEVNIDLIYHIVNHICTKMTDGAILIFVPGWEEIKKLHDMIQNTARARSSCLRVIPLHSLMPTVNQREVFDRPPPGVRKIVIATNIAETSITIDDVVFVIDCGKIKVKDFQPEMNLTSLESQWVSKANAKQRRGRAGRVQSGYCFHLFTKFHYEQFRDYLPPEMLRTRLEELCLQIKLLKLGKIASFISKAMQHPSMEAIMHAVETLTELNALDEDENLLPLGYHLARIPVEPHTGKMILFGAMLCCLDPILTVAASLSFKDAFTIPLGKEAEADAARKKFADGSKSDHIMLINAFDSWETSLKQGSSRQFCWNNFLSENTLKMLRDMKRQLAELLCDIGFVSSKNPNDANANTNSCNMAMVRAVLCAGLYPNVAHVSKVPKPHRAKYKGVGLTLKNESKIFAHPKSVNYNETFFESKWMVFYHKLKTSKVYIHDCTMVSPYPLLFFGGKIDIRKEDGAELVSVDNWVVFKAAASIAHLVKDLRQQLDQLLTKKITRPGATSWDTSVSEGAVMTAIADLITMGDEGYGQEGQRVQGSIGQHSK